MSSDNATLNMPRRKSTLAPGRVLSGLLLIAVAVFFMLKQTQFRVIEARLTAQVLGLVTATRSYSIGSSMFFGVGTPNVEAIGLTTMCSTLILVTPLLILAGFLLMIRSFAVKWVALGLVLTVALVSVCNMIRFAAMGFAQRTWGRPGFNFVHHYAGSVFVILGFVAAFILLLKIAAHSRARSNRAQPAADD